VLTAQIGLPATRYRSDTLRIAFADDLLRRLATAPGVQSAAITNIAPFSGNNTVTQFAAVGTGASTDDEFRQASWRTVTPGYFRTLGIRLLRGRLIDEHDVNGVAPSVVLSESAAKLLWPGVDPVGRQVRVQGARDPWNIVGVVTDMQDQTLEQGSQPIVYLPYAQGAQTGFWILARTAGAPMSILGTVQREVWAIDKLLPVSQPQALTDLVDGVAAQPRLTMLIFGMFGAAALALSVVGLYGLIAYTVLQQTREIGVRLALGARPAQIVSAIVRRGVSLAAAGVLVGLVMARALGKYVGSLLFGVTPNDVATYAAVGLVLIACALLASLLPAGRAARLPPTLAMRDS
jgi:putative ABC transport system permease protein